MTTEPNKKRRQVAGKAAVLRAAATGLMISVNEQVHQLIDTCFFFLGRLIFHEQLLLV